MLPQTAKDYSKKASWMIHIEVADRSRRQGKMAIMKFNQVYGYL